ncbi:host cell division inhibitor Icd-like protein [Klebsiella pneumoniae]|uniref:host cell division inhibitor Icd-like protein n=2 Tax=Klebsiella pneumoniae TaxID=573 RepID=UPI0024AD16F5|nr:host cell division inhibitor Icd-like protein [Klebsiella pneumoniae]HDO7197797.1 host cell division inhibitor Icd-like protein [Klebsiella pneumoniae]
MPHDKINSKYCLTTALNGSQNPDVAAKSATGRRNPCMLSATTDAPCVFFYVAINATERHIMAWCVHSGHSIAGHEQVSHHSTMSMVAQAGQLSGWPVSDNAGIPTPVWAIAISERRNSGDSVLSVVIGGCLMATTPISLHPQFIWIFLAVRRSDVLAKPQRKEVTAPDLTSARRVIARDFVTSFAGRLPVREVVHV